jgi:MtN3 and saliva related transmembrane protein
MKMLWVLASGLVWIAYGALKSDFVIIGANIIGLSLVATLIAFKIRDRR